ncbi:MAG: hypothetical protein ABI591_16270 [Kofleriaceae bacterium]
MKRLIVTALVACSSKSKVPPDATPPLPEAPLRDATGDADMRVLVADLLAGRACDQAIHHFGGIRDKVRKHVITGEVWIRGCKITNDGTKVTAEISGNGWQWVEKSQKKAGGTFDVNQYVKFGVTAKLTGVIDVGYDPAKHIASLWFTPSGEPAVEFKPIGDIEVERDSTWADAVGGLGSLIGRSPEDAADDAASGQGKQAVKKAAAKGFELAIDLCHNITRISKQRLPKGEMPKPSMGETDKVSIEVQRYGVMIEGPYDAHAGMTIETEVAGGAAKVNLACLADGETTAQAFLDEKANTAKPLESQVVSGHATLKVPKERCPVVVVIRSVQPNPVTVSFVRPAHEATESKGGPLARCTP